MQPDSAGRVATRPRSRATGCAERVPTRCVEGLDHECGETPRCRDSRCRCPRVDSVDGHDHEDEVAHDSVRAQAADVLGAPEQFRCRAQRGSAVRGEVQRARERGLDGRGEAIVACLQFTEPLNRDAEAVPGLRIGEPFIQCRSPCAHLVVERLGDEHLLGREMAVKGRGPDPGASGDLSDRHIQAIGGEHRTGRVEDSITVVPGVGTRFPRQSSGHHSHFSRLVRCVRYGRLLSQPLIRQNTETPGGLGSETRPVMCSNYAQAELSTAGGRPQKDGALHDFHQA
jgi:hypothetical protein